MTPMTPTDPTDAAVEVRHEEELHIGVARVPYRIVRVHRRVITEIRRLEIEVRSEVLDIEWQPAGPTIPTGAAPNPERLEFVLHGEEPEIRLVTVPRERITVTRVEVAGTTDVHAEVRSERITAEIPGQSEHQLKGSR
jgi:stress response protein YsnF